MSYLNDIHEMVQENRVKNKPIEVFLMTERFKEVLIRQIRLVPNDEKISLDDRYAYNCVCGIPFYSFATHEEVLAHALKLKGYGKNVGILRFEDNGLDEQII